MNDQHPMIYVEAAVGTGYAARHITPIRSLAFEAPDAITGEPRPTGWLTVMALLDMKASAGEDFSVSIAPTLTGNVVVTLHAPARTR